MMASGSEGGATGIDPKEDLEGSPARESYFAHAVDQCWNSFCILVGREEERPPGHSTSLLIKTMVAADSKALL